MSQLEGRPGVAMKAISLFSGVGGFEIGFERAGIETVLQAESDPWCLEVLARHWPRTERVSDVASVGRANAPVVPSRALGAEPCPSPVLGDRAGDVVGESNERDGDLRDLVYGGFPCQDISVAGRRAGLRGERNGLWFEFARVFEELRPRWCVIENVAGLLSSGQPPGADLGLILDTLVELGYGVAWRTVDAQYAGVPQGRRRVFIVGGPGDGTCAAAVLAVGEGGGGDSQASRAPGEELAASLRGRSHGAGGVNGGNNPEGGYLADVAYSLAVRGREAGQEWELGDPDIANSLRAGDGGSSRGNWMLTANAVIAGAGHHGHSSPRGDGSDNLVPALAGTFQAETYHHGGYPNQTMNTENGHVLPLASGVRRLTPRECERLMGWPDDWTRWTAGGREIADSHRYRMAGNGVVAPVAEWIGHRLVRVEELLSQRLLGIT